MSVEAKRATCAEVLLEVARADESLGIFERVMVRWATSPRVWGRYSTRIGCTIGAGIEQFIIERGVAAGVIAPEALANPSAVQWDKDTIIAFIKELFDLIIAFITALISIFS